MGLRQERLADEIRDIIASLFTGGTLNDPRIQDVTVTAAKVSPDLQVATIYYRVYGEEIDAAEIPSNYGIGSRYGSQRYMAH